MKRTLWMMTPASGGLQRLMHAVATAQTKALSADDLYRICALTKNPQDDVLGLQADRSFMSSLAHQYRQLSKTAVSPFQRSLLETVLPAASPSTEAKPVDQKDDKIGSSSTSNTDSSKAPQNTVSGGKHSINLPEPTVDERLSEMWELARNRGSVKSNVATSKEDFAPVADAEACAEEEDGDGEGLESDLMDQLDVHVAALEPQLRSLSPVQLALLLKLLASVNYQNYKHTEPLARRGCEIAAQLPRAELSRLYSNLTKLRTCDSLTAIVNQLTRHVADLTAQEVQLLALALEEQQNTSSASARLAAVLVSQALKVAPKATSLFFYRAVLTTMVRYTPQQHRQQQESALLLLKDAERFMGDGSARDLVPLLEAVAYLGLSDDPRKIKDILPLLTHLQKQVPTMSIHHVPSLLDALSVVNADTSALMAAVMDRLDVDAGKLSIPELLVVLDILSTYPPARGHVCVVSMSFAASVRAASIDRGALEKMLVSFAMMEHFTDDFYRLFHVLTKEKGGIYKLDTIDLLITSTQNVDRGGLLPGAVERAAMVKEALLSFMARATDSDVAKLHEVVAGRVQIPMNTRPPRTPSQSPFSCSIPAGSRGRGGGGKRRKKIYDPMADLL